MKTIKLLLKENVGKVGIVGDVVTVKPGYARNYLLPRGLATEPTEGNIQRLSARRAEVERELAHLRSMQEAMIAKLEGFEITMKRSANEQGVLYGGVSQHDITEALQADGFAVEDRMVRVGDQIKRLDTYDIPIVVEADLQTEIKLWVVSDKPVEDLELEGELEDEGEDVEADERANEVAEAEVEPTA